MASKVKAKIFKVIEELPEDSNFFLTIVDKSEYIRSSSKLTVKCKKCGNIQQTSPDRMFVAIKKNIHGCKICDLKRRALNHRLPLEEVKSRLSKFDNVEFPYLETEYETTNSRVTVQCKLHGNHTAVLETLFQLKYACKKCSTDAQKLSYDTIIEHFRKAHGEFYDYSKVIITPEMDTKDKVIIVCPIHGEFEQIINSHKFGKGCRSCMSNNGGVSFKALTWMDHLMEKEGIHIHHAANGGEYYLPNSNIRVDGICLETNTVYEFHGDFFHGNPIRFDHNDINPYRNQTFGETYEATLKREQQIRDLGYNLVVIWEHDYNKLKLTRKHYSGLTTFKTKYKKLDDLNALRIKLLDGEFIDTEHQHNWECLVCGKNFVRNLNKARIAYKEIGRVGCSMECSNNYFGKPQNPSWERVKTMWEEANKNGFKLFLKEGEEYKGMNVPVVASCHGCGKTFMARLTSVERAITNRKTGCRSCRYGW